MKHLYNLVNTLTLGSANYPELLSYIPDAPKILYSRGKASLSDLMTKPRIAIVGSRKVDSYGSEATTMLSRGLAEKGIVIVSGLALGIDCLAHQAALSVKGLTLAVLPSGIDYLYPATNRGVAEKILETGCIISELAGKYSPQAHDFLKRNRIISGLADAVIVTEAAVRSGSLNTARHALEQGKTVLAVPGSIFNPLCEGTNNLIRAGALPVTSVADVLAAIGYIETRASDSNIDLVARNKQEYTVLTLLKDGITDADEIAQQSGISVSELNTTLTILELDGNIVPTGGNNWVLK
jgi:DNA processing protein